MPLSKGAGLDNSSPPYADELNRFFYEGLGLQTSACLYGSAATGNWIPGRSDLDLIILVPEKKLELLGKKIREWAWASTPKYPILDGYALSSSGGTCLVRRLDDFVKVTFPSESTIDLVDQWIIKNRSRQLFGNSSIPNLFPDISHEQLRAWALETLSYMMASNPEGIVPEEKLVLSNLIWGVSWSARMLMLLRGNVCESKREALQWLASEYVDIRDLVCLLLDDYLKPDEVAPSITSEQSAIMRKFCLEQLRKESKSPRPAK